MQNTKKPIHDPSHGKHYCVVTYFTSFLYLNGFLFGSKIGKFWSVVLVVLVKNLSAVQETWIQSLGWEDPLEKEMAAHSSILAWKISWTEGPGGLQSMGSQRVGHN